MIYRERDFKAPLTVAHQTSTWVGLPDAIHFGEHDLRLAIRIGRRSNEAHLPAVFAIERGPAASSGFR